MTFGIHPKPPVKTYDEVVQDLLTQLCQNGNNSLGANAVDLDDVPSIDNLKEIYTLLASQRFTQTYGYDFTGSKAIPPSITTGTASSVQAFMDLGDGVSPASLIPGVVKQLSSQITAPTWASDPISSDLTSEFSRVASSITSGSLGNDWSAERYSQLYQAAQKYDNSVQADGVFLFVNASLTEGQVSVTRNVVLYLGVYYQVKSAAASAKDSLWNSICQTANSLISSPIPLSTPPQVGELLKILYAYRDQAFSRDFSITYSDVTSIPQDGLANVARYGQLFAYQDEDTSQLSTNVNTFVGNLTLPQWAIADVTSDVLKELQSLTGAVPHNGNAWSPVKFDKNYFPTNAGDQTLCAKGEIVYCDAISGDVKGVTLRYIYYALAFYSLTPAKEIVTNDLIAALYKSGETLLRTPPNQIPTKPTQDDLTSVLQTASVQQFKIKFSFDYADTKSQPLDISSPTTPVYAFETVGYPDLSDSNAAASIVDQQIMNGLNLPFASNEPNLISAIRQELINEIQSTLQADFSTNVRTAAIDKAFNYSNAELSPLALKVSVVFAKASLTETLQNSYTAKMVVVAFAGILYDKASEEW